MAGADAYTNWVAVYYAPNAADADGMCARLEAQGVAARVAPSRLWDAFGEDTSSVRVLVAPEHASQARDILRTHLLHTAPPPKRSLQLQATDQEEIRTEEVMASEVPGNVRIVSVTVEEVIVAYSGPDHTEQEMVLVLDAASQEEAEVVRATLAAEGIPTTLLNPNLSAGTGTLGEAVTATWRNGVFVPVVHAEAARAILSAPPLSDAELTAAEESDPLTLAEAEARVKRA